MKTVLLLQYHRPHFEVVLALRENLKHEYDVHLWSDSLSQFGRASVVSQLEIPGFDPGIAYDYIVIVSGEEDPPEKALPPELWAALNRGNVARVLHRFKKERNPGVIYLYGGSEHPFIPVVTGLDYLKASEAPDQVRGRFLIQGNIENRRNYDLVEVLAGENESLDIYMVGIKVKKEIAPKANVLEFNNLDEQDSHRICANSRFILPMIDPIRYSGYFKDRFTSSVLMGFAYALPFVAHKALFDLYPIAGFPYETDSEFLERVSEANSVSESCYNALAQQMVSALTKIFTKNTENIKFILGELGSIVGA